MIVPKFTLDSADSAAVERAFAASEPQPVGCCNWPEAFPYAPQVRFRMFHTGDRLFLRFEVAERYTAARVVEDNGEVWTDSCVEFFFAPDGPAQDDGTGYYNFETTCIGRMLLAYRRSRSEGVVRASAETLASVRRTSTLPDAPFEEREGDNRWTLTLAIPPQVLFCHAFDSWDGLRGRMNLYKCGDNLSHPHFLSWRPIDTPQPDFHRPEFFGEVEFAAEAM
ncbi:MAG: carbohydrate-binding family 9-like protein [Alistipes senegalensis]|nr:carbohydrate-binding family 9-like protein [Bacteroides cellulosilyticus]MCM1352464.1 carbohydrate-binding family 9-like protein [Alistipes senegalensis]